MNKEEVNIKMKHEVEINVNKVTGEKGDLEMKKLENEVERDDEKDIVKLRLDQLKESKLNFFVLKDIEKLADDIETNGLNHNLVVRTTNEKGSYIIISGARRYNALKILNNKYPDRYNEVYCKVIDDSNMDDINELMMIFSANREVRDCNERAIELTAAISVNKIIKGGTTNEIKRKKKALFFMLLGEKYSNERKQNDKWEQYNKLASCENERIQNAYCTHVISTLNAAYMLISLDENVQNELLDKANEDSPIKETMIRKIKNETKKTETNNVEQTNIDKKKVEKNNFEHKTVPTTPTLINATEQGVIENAIDNYYSEDDDFSDDFDNEDEVEEIDYTEVDDIMEITDADAFLRELQRRKEEGIPLFDMDELLNVDDSNLTIDTTGRIKKLLSPEKNSTKEDKTISSITKWAETVRHKIKYTDEELELFELLKEVLDEIDLKLSMQ